MPKEITKAKIACLDFSLQKAKMHLGVSVVVDDPEKLEAIRKRYSESLKWRSKITIIMEIISFIGLYLYLF